MWMVIGALFVIGSIIIICICVKTSDMYCDEVMVASSMAFLFGIIGIIIIVSNIHTMIACQTFPEKIVFDMLSSYLN